MENSLEASFFFGRFSKSPPCLPRTKTQNPLRHSNFTFHWVPVVIGFAPRLKLPCLLDALLQCTLSFLQEKGACATARGGCSGKKSNKRSGSRLFFRPFQLKLSGIKSPTQIVNNHRPSKCIESWEDFVSNEISFLETRFLLLKCFLFQVIC